MERIRRAQAKGKKDVKLSKGELAAYQRRLERIEDEKRRRRRERRVAIPISQLDPSSRNKRQTSESDSPPRQSSPELGDERQPAYPPMGYFPPPSSHPRQRSGTTSSRSRPPSRTASDRERGSSPFTYTYVRRPDSSAPRHAPPDPATGLPLSQHSQSFGDSVSSSRSRADNTLQPPVDSIQYLTAGSRTSYQPGLGSVRNSLQDPADIYAMYGAGPSNGDREPPNGDDVANDNLGREARKVSGSGTASRGRRRESIDGRRESGADRRASRDRTPPQSSSSKKSSAVQSPRKRKSVSGTVRSGHRKGK
ncbi:hypothetical protein VTK26DRAFT_1564 [Humicola hyalothermophila]